MPKLRIGLTIAGAVSLGSYEGGALAALLIAAQESGGAIVIDAITGASAGAITAVLAARCLLRGADPVAAMTAAWVDLPSLKHLATSSPGGPLSSKALAEAADRLLSDGPEGLPDGDQRLRQAEDVRLLLTIATLGGFQYRIPSLQSETPITALTYCDLAKSHLTSTSTAADYKEIGDAALASGANAVGFPPKLLRRSDEAIKDAIRNGVQNPPNPLGAWYTDGGTIDNEPLGHLLDVISEVDADGQRLLVLVHPNPSGPRPPDLWGDPTKQPRWAVTGSRARNMGREQSIFDDLRRMEKTNTRLEGVEKLVEAFGETLASLDEDLGAEEAAKVRARLVAGLRGAIDDVHEQHAEIARKALRPEKAFVPVPPDADPTSVLRAAIHRATGLSGKEPARIEVVSPDLDTSGRPPDELLAGERLGHFFGFLAERFRQSDFALGYRNMMVFIEKILPKYDVADEVAAVLPAVRNRYDQLGWDGIRWGHATFADLSIGEKLRLAGLGAHIAHIAESDLRHWHSELPVGS